MRKCGLLLIPCFVWAEDTSSVSSVSSVSMPDSLTAVLSDVAKDAYISGLELSMAVGIAVCAVGVAVGLIRRGAGY